MESPQEISMALFAYPLALPFPVLIDVYEFPTKLMFVMTHDQIGATLCFIVIEYLK